MKLYTLVHTELQEFIQNGNNARWFGTCHRNLSEQEAYELRIRLMQSNPDYYYKMIKQ